MNYSFIFICLDALPACPPHACSAFEKKKRALDPGVADSCELPCGDWEPNPDPVAGAATNC